MRAIRLFLWIACLFCGLVNLAFLTPPVQRLLAPYGIDGAVLYFPICVDLSLVRAGAFEAHDVRIFFAFSKLKDKVLPLGKVSISRLELVENSAAEDAPPPPPPAPLQTELFIDAFVLPGSKKTIRIQGELVLDESEVRLGGCLNGDNWVIKTYLSLPIGQKLKAGQVRINTGSFWLAAPLLLHKDGIEIDFDKARGRHIETKGKAVFGKTVQRADVQLRAKDLADPDFDTMHINVALDAKDASLKEGRIDFILGKDGQEPFFEAHTTLGENALIERLLVSDSKNFELRAKGQAHFFTDKHLVTFDLAQVRVDHFDSNLASTDGQATIGLTPRSLELVSAKLKDGSKEGLITGSGAFFFDRLLLDLHVAADRLLWNDHNGLTMQLVGRGRISGPWPNIILKADATVTHAILDLDQHKERPSPISLNTEFIRGERERAARRAQHTLGLDLNLAFDQGLIAKGQGQTSTWRGHVRLVNNVRHPEFQGALNVYEGRFLFAGAEFLLQEGSLQFHGPFDKAFLHTVARREMPALRAEIRISGPIDELSVALASDPAYSTKEILAKILYGDSDELTDFQALALAQAAASLGHGVPIHNPLDTIKKAVGLDRIEFSSSGSKAEDASFVLGKYLGRNLYVTYNRKLFEETRSVGLEMKISKQVTVEAATDIDSEGSIKVRWQKDY